MKYNYTKENLETIIKECLSFRQVFSKIGIPPCGGNYKTLHSKIKIWDLDISHFTGAGWNVGDRYRPFGKKGKIEDILVKNSLYVSSTSLRKRLLKDGIKDYICESCKLKEWLNKPIKLELHHINGINDDHRIENIQLLCPNCHAFTDNYRGKNIRSSVGTDIQV